MMAETSGPIAPKIIKWLWAGLFLACAINRGGAAGATEAKTLLDVWTRSQGAGTEVVLVGDGELSNYKVSGLREPARIVVDLQGVETYRFDSAKVCPTQEVQRVRVARHPHMVRVVLDLQGGNGPVPYKAHRQGDRLILSLGDSPLELEPSRNEELMEAQRILSPSEGRVPMKDKWPSEERYVASLKLQGAGVELVDSDVSTLSFPANIWDPKEREALSETPPKTISGDGDSEGLASLGVTGGVEPKKPVIRGARGSEEQRLGVVKGIPTPRSETDMVTVATPVTGHDPKEKTGDLVRWVDPRTDAPYRKQGTFVPASIKAHGKVFSMAQVAKKTPTGALKVSPAEAAEEEEEEEFKVITGMEPGKVYTGQRMDLDLQDIDLDNVFRLLAEVSNLNIIVSEKVKGKVTMRLKDVPWDQALDLILATQKLGMIRQGNVLRVAPLKDLMEEEKERKRLRQERIQAKIEAEKRLQEAQIEAEERQRKLRPFVTEFIVLNYTKAKDFQAQIKDILTKEPKLERVGTAVVDERTNTVTVTDYPEKIERIKQYKERVDRPTPQVLIEARIVKATKTFARELGVQWGGQYAQFDKSGEWAWGVSSATGTGTTPPATPSSWRSGSFTQGTGHDFFPLSGWMVNLPATLLPTPPGIGFQVGRLVGDLINLDLRLSAAEREGLTKIISRPKVMTLDNVEATIKQGREIPFTQVNPEGNVSVVYKEASLKATVTPQISPDGRVRLKLDVTDDFPDRSNANPITGNPEIVKRQGTTEVLVKDGETVVIGGVLEETRATSEDGVPWFKDLPGLNWFFERKTRRHDQTELLIFVTPFIVEQT